MAKVKLDLDRKAQEIHASSATHIAAIGSPEGLAAFPTPDPNAADFLVTHNALGSAITLIATLEGQLAAARAALPGALENHKENLRARATYVEDTSVGDPAIIPISGFEVAGSTTQPIVPLPRPEGVKAAMAKFPGVVTVIAPSIKGAQTYVIESRLHEVAAAWTQAKLSTKSRNDIPGLVSGKEYAFRVAVIGAAGQSPWSDEAVCMAP